MAAPPSTAPGPEDEDLVGRKLNNRYLVETHIGEGGFGDVYKAKQIQMNRDVAIKVLSPGMTKDPKLVERFKREAQSACNLRDPHTIITYDFDETENGLLYIAMELLKGETLFDVLEREKRLPANRVVGIVEQTCSSLGEAHLQGIVHRDIKPENIFLEARPDHPDFVKILDFGIAKIVGGEMSQGPALTAAGQTLGTLEYMSPEQLMGQKLDGRSDIYALGMLTYQMLTGSLPFGDSASPAAMIQWHLKENVRPPSQVVPGCPPDLDPILARMLHKDRDQRYPSVVELKQDLQMLMARHGWIAGGASGPMTAVPPVALPQAPSGPGPMAPGPGLAPPPGPVYGGAQPAQTAPVTMPAHPVASGKGKGSPVGIIVAVVLALAVGGFLLYWFVLRDKGGSESGKPEKEKKGKDAMSAVDKGGKGKAEGPRRASAERPRPARERAVAEAPRPRDGGERPAARPSAPSLGGILGVLKEGAGGDKKGEGGSVGGLGALLAGPELPSAGRVIGGRRARTGLKASEDDPLRVVPPEMTFVARVDLAPFRKAPWVDRILKRVPAAAMGQLLTKTKELGVDIGKLRGLAMGGNFPEGKGAQPVLLFALAGPVDGRTLMTKFREGKGRVSTQRIAGYAVMAKDDGRLVVPSPGLAIMASDKVIQHGLSRMSQPRVKSFLEAGWAPRALKDAGAPASPHLFFAVHLPAAARKSTGELLVKIQAGRASDEVRSVLLAANATPKGLQLTLVADCSSAGVASKLGAFLPLAVKMIGGNLPAPLKPLVDGLQFGASGSTVYARLGLDEPQILLLLQLLTADKK